MCTRPGRECGLCRPVPRCDALFRTAVLRFLLGNVRIRPWHFREATRPVRIRASMRLDAPAGGQPPTGRGRISRLAGADQAASFGLDRPLAGAGVR